MIGVGRVERGRRALGVVCVAHVAAPAESCSTAVQASTHGLYHLTYKTGGECRWRLVEYTALWLHRHTFACCPNALPLSSTLA